MCFFLLHACWYGTRKEDFFNNGQLKEVGNVEEGFKEGMWKFYYEDGQFRALKHWINGGLSKINEDGEWKTFYPNGQLKSIGYYSNGSKEGTWKEYNEDGELLKSKEYQFGILQKE